MEDEDILADSIVKSFAYAENGGAPNIDNPSAGKTGEMKSIFQFTPDTWKADSKRYLGKEEPLTSDSETYVMKQKVKDWIKQKKTVRQMASIHNAGAGEPNAYTGKFSTGKSSVGVNQKYGVKYNVPNYANRVLDYSKKFYTEKLTKNIQSAGQKVQSQQQSESTSTANSTDPLSNVMSTIKQASNTPQQNNAQ